MGTLIQRVLAAGPLNLNLTATSSLTPDNLVNSVLKWIGGLLGVIVFFYLIYGGFLYMTAAGNTEQTKKGGQVIINAILGLIIIVLAYGITTYIIGLIRGTAGVGAS